MDEATTRPNRRYEWLASSVAVICAYYSLSVSLVLPKFRAMLAELGDEALGGPISRAVFLNPGIATGLTLLVTLVTLGSIWLNYRFSGIVSALGIAVLGISTHFLCNLALAPLVRVVNAMGGG